MTPALPKREREFDTRTVRRNVRSGRITSAEYNEFLAALPDVANKVRAADDYDDDDDDDYDDDDDDDDDDGGDVDAASS